MIIILVLYSFLNIGCNRTKSEDIGDVTRDANGKLNPIITYESNCPDVTLFTRDSKKINLSEYAGNVIVLRFSRFNIQDYPYLVFLDHLAQKYKNKGLIFFFIHLLSRNINPNIKSYAFTSPVVDDDGLILSQFHANLNDLIIISKDFKIKLKDNQLDNIRINSQVTRYLYSGEKYESGINDDERAETIKKINYINIRRNELESIKLQMEKHKSLINLTVSPCTTCPNMQRLKIISELRDKLKHENVKLFILFGKGNDPDIIKSIITNNDIPKDITVGIIQGVVGIEPLEYYSIFKYDLENTLIIFNELGDDIFIETKSNSKMISGEYLGKYVL